MSNPDDPLNAPVPHTGDDEPLNTVSAFELTARRDHMQAKHAGEFEDCAETDCAQARDMLGGVR